MKVKDKYIAIFFHNFNGTYKKIGQAKFTLNQKSQFSYKGKAFTLTYSKPIYNDKNKSYYFFDYGSKGQIFMNQPEEEELGLILEFLDDIANKHTVGDILKASKEKMKWWEILAYIMIGISLFLGYIAGKNKWF